MRGSGGSERGGGMCITVRGRSKRMRRKMGMCEGEEAREGRVVIGIWRGIVQCMGQGWCVGRRRGGDKGKGRSWGMCNGVVGGLGRRRG